MVSVPPNMDISDFPTCFLIEDYFHEVLMPWKNLDCRSMLKWVICFWKQWTCTWAEIQLLVAKNLFQLNSWNNWVVRDSSLPFPSFLGIPSPVWAAEWSSGAGSGAAWLGWGTGNSQNSPQASDSLKKVCTAQAAGIGQQGRKGIKRLIHWLRNSPKLQSLVGQNNLKYLGIVLW